MSEAWNSQELPSRTKASLSSKWRDIKSRDTLLGSSERKGTSRALGRPPDINVPAHQDVNTIQGVSPAAVKPVATTQAPAHVHSVKKPVDMGNCSAEDITSVFKKNLRKARKIGPQI